MRKGTLINRWILSNGLLCGLCTLSFALSTMVPTWAWIRIVNPGSEPGQQCGLAAGMEITQVAEHNGRYLAKVTSRAQVRGGFIGATTCQVGTLFFIDIGVFGQLQKAYEERIAEEAAERELAHQLLQRAP